jgi:hypothetical protein
MGNGTIAAGTTDGVAAGGKRTVADRIGMLGVPILAVLLLVVLPLALSEFRLSLLAKYLPLSRPSGSC